MANRTVLVKDIDTLIEKIFKRVKILQKQTASNAAHPKDCPQKHRMQMQPFFIFFCNILQYISRQETKQQ